MNEHSQEFKLKSANILVFFLLLTSLMLKGRSGRWSDLATIFERRVRTLQPPEIEVAGIRSRLRFSVGKKEEERFEEIRVEVIGKT